MDITTHQDRRQLITGLVKDVADLYMLKKTMC